MWDWITAEVEKLRLRNQQFATSLEADKTACCLDSIALLQVTRKHPNCVCLVLLFPPSKASRQKRAWTTPPARVGSSAMAPASAPHPLDRARTPTRCMVSVVLRPSMPSRRHCPSWVSSHLFVYSAALLSTYYVPGPISSSRDAVVGRRDNDSCPHGDYKGRRERLTIKQGSK